MSKCYFHSDREATHSDSVIDFDAVSSPSVGTHAVAYKRIPICYECSITRQQSNTARIEKLPEKEEQG